MRLIKLIIIAFSVLFIANASAQEFIKLPEPDKTGGKPLMQALNERKSSRDFINKDLTDQQLSNLLWAAYGINRADDGKHTTPTSRNKQDIQIYVTTSKGLFLYIPEKHTLEQLSKLDVRKIAGKQDFVKDAAVNLIYVSNFDKLGNGDDNTKLMTAATHCGFIGQNVYLYCASENLISVFRAWVDKDEITSALNLKPNQHVIYCQSVGFEKE